MSKWKNIKSTYMSDGTVRPVYAYLTDNDMEEGCVIANFDIKDKTVTYLDDNARTDLYAQEVIQGILKEYGIDIQIVALKDRHAIVKRGNKEYVVVCGFNGLGADWEQGIYFTYWGDESHKLSCLAGAIDEFRIRTEPDYVSRAQLEEFYERTNSACISRERLEELAKKFKDGLVADGEEEAMKYFNCICELTDAEKQWFELGQYEANAEDDAWDDGSNIGCSDCPDSECNGHCMSCSYRPI